MIALDSAKSLVLVGGTAAHATHCCASGVSITSSGDTPLAATLAWVDTSMQTLLAPPAAGEQTVVKNITVWVAAGGSVPVAVAINDGGNLRTLCSATLAAGESLAYEGGKGFARYSAAGVPMVGAAASAQPAALSRQRLALNKPSLGAMVGGSDGAMWRGAGYPLQGAVPGAAAACSKASTGAMPLAQRTGGQVRRLLGLELMSSVAGQTFYLEDRLAHMGGLSGALSTAQTVGLDLAALGANMAQRVGDSAFDPYREVVWYLDWYTATGAAAATPTVNVTYADGTSGNCGIWALGATALPASVAANRRYQILSATGKAIRGVNSVTLSASTGTAGSFGVTAVRKLATLVTHIASKTEVLVFPRESAPLIHDEACLTLSFTSSTSLSGTAVGAVVQEVAPA
ncbi:MAG: hypothetical protein ACT4NV_02970 [Rhodoferax sp.]